MTHDEMAFSEVVSRVWQPCLFSAIGNPLFKQNEDISSCLQLWQPRPEVSPTAILNEEKALGTRLSYHFTVQ